MKKNELLSPVQWCNTNIATSYKSIKSPEIISNTKHDTHFRFSPLTISYALPVNRSSERAYTHCFVYGCAEHTSTWLCT